MTILNPLYAHELQFPIEVVIWDEYALYRASWQRVGIARNRRGLYSLLGKAHARADRRWGTNEYQRPFLTTGGPRMGTVGVREYREER